MPVPTGPQWSDFSPLEEQIPAGVGEVAKEAVQTGASIAKRGFDSASKGTQAATLATYAAGVLGAAGGALPASTGLLVAASSPVLPFARRGVEHLSAKMRNPGRLPIKRALNPVRYIQGLLDPPGTPPRR